MAQPDSTPPPPFDFGSGDAFDDVRHSIPIRLLAPAAKGPAHLGLDAPVVAAVLALCSVNPRGTPLPLTTIIHFMPLPAASPPLLGGGEAAISKAFLPLQTALQVEHRL